MRCGRLTMCSPGKRRGRFGGCHAPPYATAEAQFKAGGAVQFLRGGYALNFGRHVAILHGKDRWRTFLTDASVRAEFVALSKEVAKVIKGDSIFFGPELGQLSDLLFDGANIEDMFKFLIENGGKADLDIARIYSQEEVDHLWRSPSHLFPLLHFR